jgi:hypothetical protein
MMEMRRYRWLSKLNAMEESRSPRRMLGAWCPTTPRKAGRPTQTIRHAYITTLEKLGFEEEKGQLREWMTVATVEIDQHGGRELNYTYSRASYRVFHESPQALNEHEQK